MTRHKATPAIPPPGHLQPSSAGFWAEIQSDYQVTDAAGLRLLQAACEALDTAEAARLAIAEFGQTFVDRLGNPRPRPEVQIQRNALLTYARLVRELQLDPPGTK